MSQGYGGKAFCFTSRLMKVGNIIQLNWTNIEKAMSVWSQGSQVFRLETFNFAQYISGDHNGQDGSMAQATWQFWLEGIAPSDTPPSDATVRAGWHYTRQPGENFAVLTAINRYPDRFLPPMDPELPLDELPTLIYAIAMNLDFCAHVLLDRRYPEPRTQRDAILTILGAWEEETERTLYWTIRTIAGQPCVLV